MTVHNGRPEAPMDSAASTPGAEDLQNIWNSVVGRRSFLRQAGVASAVAIPATAVAASGASAKTRRARASHTQPTEGDIAILRFLTWAELIESDFWEQYAELGGQAGSPERPTDGGNHFYVSALSQLDGDMPQYISDNTDDEESHQAFLNAYLISKGARPVSLERFRTLPSTEASGAKDKKRLTNLQSLNVDTSWYLRYRAETNPDFGATFGQAVTINNQPTIPVDDKETPPNLDAATPTPGDAQHQRMQAIANSAGFHFAAIEQGGSSLYTAMSLKATSLEVLRIVVAIGGVETNHFSLWHDKAGNAVNDPLAGVTDPETGTTFPNLNKSGGEATQTNLILPEPCEFIPGLPACSVVRPTRNSIAGAMAAFNGFNDSGLFKGQSEAFLRFSRRLAREADAAERAVG
jgi:hypothetical protein